MGYAGPADFTYDLNAVLRRLGQDPDGRSTPWKIRYLQALVDTASFPEPLPLLRGITLCKAVAARSRWQKAAVDSWFDDRLPPSGGASPEDPIARRESERLMDERAAAIGLRVIAGGAA